LTDAGTAIEGLPSFVQPPLREVAIALAVEGLEKATAVDFGLLWERFANAYPRVEQFPRVAVEVEDLSAAIQGASIRFEVAQLAPSNCLWFLSTDGSQAVEIQSDRLAWHWRRPTDQELYPRFPYVRDHFAEAYQVVDNFVRDRLGGQLKPVQAEVRYVNEIPAQGAPLGHGDPDRLFRPWTASGFVLPGSAEDVRIATRHRLPEDPRTTGGRLLVNLEPAYRSSNQQPVYVLSLLTRGRPTPPAHLEEVLRFADLCHEVIVRSFTNLTTETKHEEWGLER
jgi:uncharacterized protein (TIGR04255 family)